MSLRMQSSHGGLSKPVPAVTCLSSAAALRETPYHGYWSDVADRVLSAHSEAATQRPAKISDARPATHRPSRSSLPGSPGFCVRPAYSEASSLRPACTSGARPATYRPGRSSLPEPLHAPRVSSESVSQPLVGPSTHSVAASLRPASMSEARLATHRPGRLSHPDPLQSLGVSSEGLSQPFIGRRASCSSLLLQDQAGARVLLSQAGIPEGCVMQCRRDGLAMRPPLGVGAFTRSKAKLVPEVDDADASTAAGSSSTLASNDEPPANTREAAALNPWARSLGGHSFVVCFCEMSLLPLSAAHVRAATGAVSLLNMCGCDPSDICVVLAFASAYFASIVQTSHHRDVMASEEMVNLLAVCIFVAHCFVLDNNCPLHVWRDMVLQSRCSLRALNAATVHVLRVMDFRLRLDDVILRRRLRQLLAHADIEAC